MPDRRAATASDAILAPVRWLVAMSCVVGCYATDPPPGADCAANNACPTPLACSLVTNTCEVHPINVVQQITAYSPGAGTLSATLPQAPAAGDVLVMIGGNPHNTLAAVTGAGVAWQRAARSTDNANIELWYGTTDGSDATVTIALPGATLPMSLEVVEWTGLASPAVLEAGTGVSGLSSPASAGTLATTAPDLILFAVGDDTPNTFGTPSPGAWIALDSILESGHQQAAWFVVAEPPETVAPAVSETANSWDAVVVALELGPND